MDYLGSKRYSVWLLLLTLAVCASQMHPGFAAIFALALIAIMLLAMRFIAHCEGEYMAQQERKGHGSVTRSLVRELLWGGGFAAIIIVVFFAVVKHVPWLLFAVSS